MHIFRKSMDLLISSILSILKKSMIVLKYVVFVINSVAQLRPKAGQRTVENPLDVRQMID